MVDSTKNLVNACQKVVDWMERQALRSEEQAKDTRFLSLSEACAADGKNYRAMARDLKAAIKAVADGR